MSETVTQYRVEHRTAGDAFGKPCGRWSEVYFGGNEDTVLEVALARLRLCNEEADARTIEEGAMQRMQYRLATREVTTTEWAELELPVKAGKR